MKMTSLKRSLSGLLAALMLVTLLPSAAWAADIIDSGTCGDNLTWAVDDEGTLTISGAGAMEDYWGDDVPWYDHRDSIQMVVIGQGVTSIGQYAFFECDSLTSVSLGNGVTSIDNFAFAFCDSLTSVTIPNSVTSIDGSAFMGCDSLTVIRVASENPEYSSDSSGVLFNKVKTELLCYPAGRSGSYTIPNTVTSIGDEAFSYCSSLTSVTIPNSVTSIGDWAFFSCDSLSSITIPNSVTSIGERAFSYCSSMTTIRVASGNPNYCCDSYGVLFNKAKTELLCYPAGRSGSYTISNSVTAIGDYAFFDCSSLSSITIPDSVTSIGYSAFDSCDSLTSVSLGNGVTSIGDHAFDSCDSLTSVSLGNGVTSIGDWAFDSCSSLSSINISNSVTNIGDHAFDSCSSLTGMEIPDSVTSIGVSAFNGCSKLKTIYVASGNPSYASDSYGVLFNKAKTEILWFSSCFSGSYSIPDTVTSIAEDTFAYCDGLTAISVPASVTSIGRFAFGECRNLSQIILPDSLLYIGSVILLYTAYYENEANWENGMLYVGQYLLESREDITEAPIRSGTRLLADNAFAGRGSLRSVSIPDSVTIIGGGAFYDCSSLTGITIPDSVVSIGSHAFSECSSLTSIRMPNKITSIGAYMFAWCKSLPSITIPDSVTMIGEWAFDDCDSLTDVYYAGSKSQWNKISIATYGSGYLLNATIHFAKSDTPAAPKISSSIVTSTGRIKLTWSAVDNAAKYYIYRSTDGGKTYKYYDSTTKTSYTNTSVTPGKTYYYKLKAVGEDGATSKYSNVVYRTADCARPVVKISNVASSGALKLTWDSVTGASKYYIYRSTDMGETYTYYTSTTSTSWTNKSVTPGKTYYYKVKAICGKSSYGDSAYSTAVSRTADCARPVVKVSNVASSGAIKLSWSAVTGASKYYVYRSTDGGKTYSYYTSTTSTSWTNKSVTPGKTYYYKVIAVCGKSSYGNSAYSTVVSRSADCARPDVTITRSSSGKPLLKWKAITGAEEYVIYRATSKTGTYTKMFTTTKLSYTNTGAKSGTTYYYKVMAICAKSSYGNSAYSNIVSIKSK